LARPMLAATPIHPYQRHEIPWLPGACREARRFRPPAALESFRLWRQRSIGGRDDFVPAQARLTASAGEKGSRPRSVGGMQRQSGPGGKSAPRVLGSASNLGRMSDARMRLPEAPFALNHCAAHVLPIHHDGNAGPAGHDDHGSRIDPSGRAASASNNEAQRHDQVPAHIHEDRSVAARDPSWHQTSNGVLPGALQSKGSARRRAADHLAMHNRRCAANGFQL
jgi:hypothetical protein